MYDEFSIDICNTIIFIIKCRKLHIATHASGPKEIGTWYGVLAQYVPEALCNTSNLGVCGPFFSGRISSHNVRAVLWLEIGPGENGP